MYVNEMALPTCYSSNLKYELIHDVECQIGALVVHISVYLTSIGCATHVAFVRIVTLEYIFSAA